MSKREYDVLIIGGGINGAAIAHDAALRGLKAALVEKNDFGSGTTSATSKLAHGGLRYLENFEIGMVRESLKERRILETIAPHLVYPIPFILPIYKEDYNKSMIKLGMILYDILSYDKNKVPYDKQKMDKHKILKTEEVLKLEPSLYKEGLVGAAQYFDCQISNPEKLCLEFILSAESNGADVANYAEVTEMIIEKNKVLGVKVKDKANGKQYDLKSVITVNVSGPWLDKIIKMYKQEYNPMVRGTKGIHIITHKLTNHALVLATKTKRTFFIIPWRDHSLIGTTDTDYKEDLDVVRATKEDIEGLIEDVNGAYPASLKLKNVKFSYAGIRPLVYEEGKPEIKLSREYKIVDNKKEDCIEGLVTIVGGKLTTARNLAEEAMDMIMKKLGKKGKCITEETSLHGSTGSMEEYLEEAIKENIADKSTVEHLIKTYGSKYKAVLNYNNDERLCKKIPGIKAQIPYAIEKEMALTLNDFLLRRIGIGTLGNPGKECVKKIAGVMASYLGWDKAKTEEEIMEFYKKLKVY